MFTLFIVDDEPAAIKYINQLIQFVKDDFRVTGEFEDAHECLERLKQEQPDVIISDIKLPGMSGLELIRKVNAEYPCITCLVLSAYSDFEYAREAIRGRAYEYLVKPVILDEFVKTMNHIRITIAAGYLKERNQLISNMYHDEPVEGQKLKKYFEFERYYGILVRKNGLPADEGKENEKVISSGLYESIVVYGSDENEALFLVPEECVANSNLLQIADRLKNELRSDQVKLTAIITRTSFCVSDMPSVVKKLYSRLYQTIVMGKETTVYLEDSRQTLDLNRDEKLMINKIEEELVRGENEKAYLRFEELCNIFEAKDMPELLVRRTVRHLIYTLWMSSQEQYGWKEQELLLDNLFSGSLSVKSLCKNLAEFFRISESHIAVNKIDTAENFEKVSRYIRQNLKEPLTLGKLSKHFGISQAYLTRMFRKYESTSFSVFLTNERIEEAKKIIINHPDWFVKDVSRMVGYQDQFYFSRVFRAYTGYCPSDYILMRQE